jgi:serine/threonine protein kinase
MIDKKQKWQVGDRIADRYQIHQILGGEGKSGMGIVYLCYDHKLEASFALKTFEENIFLEEYQKLLREEMVVSFLPRYHQWIRELLVERKIKQNRHGHFFGDILYDYDKSNNYPQTTG